MGSEQVADSWAELKGDKCNERQERRARRAGPGRGREEERGQEGDVCEVTVRQVRDKLDAIGFTERTLFPGLDGLCDFLRRYYTPDKTMAVSSSS
eukprot:764061-Hanusia_phi.AAC.2